MRTTTYDQAFWEARAAQAVEAAKLATHPMVKQVLEKIASASIAAGAAQPTRRGNRGV